MKFKSNILLAAGLLVGAVACDDGYIDGIQQVPPGADASAPEVLVNFPTEGALIRAKEDVTSIDIKLEVTDDIEIGQIKVTLDDKEIGSYSDFKDYRRALIDLSYDQLTNGKHMLEVSATDLAGKSNSTSVSFEKTEPYQPKYEGEVFYLPFDGEYLELVNLIKAEVEGSPGFTMDKVQGTNAYSGAVESYITFPTEGLLGEEFSASFWYKINADPDRAGILVIGPPDEDNPDAMNNRTSGFRLFREGSATRQVIKLNVGNGTADSWYDGGNNAAIDPSTNKEWVHIAFTISGSECAVYLDGEVARKGSFTGVDWTGCDILSIASGAPRFTEWGHLSDLSLMDELRIFNKALTQDEVKTIIANEKP